MKLVSGSGKSSKRRPVKKRGGGENGRTERSARTEKTVSSQDTAASRNRNVPAEEDTRKSANGDSSKPESRKPDARTPESRKPDAKKPESKSPDSKKPAKKRKTGVIAAVIILSVIIVGFVALVVSLGYYVSSLDTIYPNVWVDGIKVSDMTVAEATNALINGGYENSADGISITMIFPDETTFTVTGDEVGLSLDANEAASAAFTFGRGGTFFENEIAYIRALYNRTELTGLSSPSYNDDIIRELASEYVHNFNETLFDNNLEVTDVSITIVKGTGMEQADVDEVYDLAVQTLKHAMEENQHLNVHYIPERKDEEMFNLQSMFEYIHVDPISSEYDPETMSATESSPGKTFDLEEAERMLYNAEYGDTIVIPIVVLEPEMTQEMLNSMLFRDVLCERTTRIGGTSNRFSNIKLASSKIHEKLFNPGEMFSFNEIVGIRTTANGFLMAGAYVGGVLTDEVGGGICQVSSTLYAAILLTHLEVVERRPHGMVVSYLPYGSDATVNWGSIDFKFRNNTDFPLRIESTIDNRDITIKIIGTKLDNTYIEIETIIIATNPFKIVEREDEEVPPGESRVFTPGMTGYVVETWQIYFSEEGNELSRTLVGGKRDTYRVQDRVILHGPPLPPPPVVVPDPTPDPPPDPGPGDGGVTP